MTKMVIKIKINYSLKIVLLKSFLMNNYTVCGNKLNVRKNIETEGNNI